MADAGNLPRIAVAQLGARMHYAVPRIFHEAGMLERLFTDSYVGNKPWLEAGLRAMPRLARPRAVDRWLGRHGAGVPPEKVTSFELFGLWRTRQEARVRTSHDEARFLTQRNRLFNERILQQGLGSANTVWGFNGASLELFRWAKGRGLRTVLEQSMAPRRSYGRLMRAELERWPGWQPDLSPPTDDDPLLRREEAEWRLADIIVCGSQFVVDELALCSGPVERSVLVPYGVDPKCFRSPPLRERRSNDRLHVLFVGEVGLRKGVPYLLHALQKLGPDLVDSRFAGRIALDPAKLRQYGSIATFLGPIPRLQMPDLFRWADILALPSICEGSATAIYEALTSGVPVICTPGAGAFIEHGGPVQVIEPHATALELALKQRHQNAVPRLSFDTHPWSQAAYAARLVEVMKRLGRRVIPSRAR